jgi:uncharacterized damage-inducible protein DinB
MTVAHYLTALAANTQTMLELVRPYSPAELAFRPAGEECSMADLLEHVCLSETRTVQLLALPSAQIAPVREIYGDAMLRQILLSYTDKPRLTSPETAELQGSVTSYAAFERRFVAQRQQLSTQLASGRLVVSNQAHKHAYLGEMTLMDWLYYLVHHASHHHHDIRELAQLLPARLQQRAWAAQL